MSKAIEGAAMLAGAVGMGVAAYLDPALIASPAFDKIWAALIIGGISMEAGAIAGALTSNRGMAITTRQTAACRQVIWGQQRVGGVSVFESTTGSSHDQYNYVIVVAGHEVYNFVNLYLDGRQVHWLGSGAGYSVRNGIGFGGVADNNSYTGPNGVQYNFGGTGHSGIYCEARFGDQAPGDVIGALTANDPNWAADGHGNSPWLGGCAYFYLKVENNTNLFPNPPEIRVTVNGKCDIWDPRTSTKGFTQNAALILADVIADPTFGLGDPSVNQGQLIAAANVCDEVVALGVAPGTLTESRYTFNYHTDTSTAPGDILATMLPGMAGRLSRIGGEWWIWPAYWQGPSFSFDEGDLTAAVQWKPYRSFRDLINRVNGTYIAPTYPYNIAGNLYDQNGFYNGMAQNNFPFAWQPTSYPQYAADPLHGFASDEFLNEDSGVIGSWSNTVTYNEGDVVVESNIIYQSLVAANIGNDPSTSTADWIPYNVLLPKELSLLTVISVSQAQRVAKIVLMRNRQQGTGNFEMFPKAFAMQPTDVMQFTFPALGWTEKTLEVVGMSPPVPQRGDDGALKLVCGVAVGETDTSVYEWSIAEELTVYDVPATPTQTSYNPAPPTSMTLISGAGTAVVNLDGSVQPRIEVTWDTPLDVLTKQIQIQYALSGSGNWISAPSVDVALNLGFISGVVAGTAYDVRIRSARANGAISAWEEIDGYTVSVTISVTGMLQVAPEGTLIGEAPTVSTADIIVETFSPNVGPPGVTCLPAGPFTITGLTQSTLYWVYYIDPTFAGGAITPVATTNSADFLGKVGYFLIGDLITPVFGAGGGGGGGGGARYVPSSFSDIGTRTTTNGASAYDGNTSSFANVSGSWKFISGTSHSDTIGDCLFQGFPSIVTAIATTLNVTAQATTGDILCELFGFGSTLLSTTTAAGLTTYTVAIPIGTNLNSVTVEAVVDGSTSTTGTNDLASLRIYEIWIQ